jgi:replicative DNA helicase
MRKEQYYGQQPHSEEVERAILSGILNSPAKMVDIKAILPHRDYFYVPQHTTIYHALLLMYEEGFGISLVTLAEWLKNYDLAEQAGGYSYLTDIMEEYSPWEDFKKLAGMIASHWRSREFLKESFLTTEKIYENSLGSNKAISEHVQKLGDLLNSNSASGLEHCKAAVMEIREAVENSRKGIRTVSHYTSTGFKEIDNVILGLKDTSLIVVAGRPGSGKSGYSTNMAVNIAKRGLPVALFSLEMGKDEIMERIIAGESGFSTHKVKTGALRNHEYEIFDRRTKEILDLPLYIDDTDCGTVDKIRAKTQSLKNRVPHGKIGAVIIDYIHIMDREGTGNEADEINKITRNLKKLARELKVPVVALSQLNRKVEERPNKRPMLADLKSSSGIEQDADIVMFLYRDEYYNEDSDEKGIAEVNIAKHRGGPTGTVKLFFDKKLVKFQDLET